MIEQQQLDKVSAGATWFEAFMHDHPVVFAILVATIASWVVTAALNYWLESGPKKKRNLRTIDCLIAGALVAIMLSGHVDWRVLIGLSLLVGGASPFAYFAFSESVSKFFPSMRPYLSLRELAEEPKAAP